jgi:hypothetical protein
MKPAGGAHRHPAHGGAHPGAHRYHGPHQVPRPKALDAALLPGSRAGGATVVQQAHLPGVPARGRDYQRDDAPDPQHLRGAGSHARDIHKVTFWAAGAWSGSSWCAHPSPHPPASPSPGAAGITRSHVAFIDAASLPRASDPGLHLGMAKYSRVSGTLLQVAGLTRQGQIADALAATSRPGAQGARPAGARLTGGSTRSAAPTAPAGPAAPRSPPPALRRRLSKRAAR